MPKPKKKINKILLTIIIILAVLIVLAIAALFLFKSYYGKSNYVRDESIEVVDNTDIAEAEAKQDEQTEGVESSDDDAELTEEEQDELRDLAATEVEEPEAEEFEGTYNLLLVGVDRRDTTWYGNSDTMILITVNSNMKTIYMTSFMRDLYADIPGIGVRKLNAAYANGGGPLLVTTIQQNYKVNIDNYASVDFSGMTDIIDILGGVDINISAAEIKVANNYIKEMCNLRGLNSADYLLSTEGYQHMNGIQAVAYARIRYVGNSDFERTSRQRTVLNQLINTLKGYSLFDIMGVADDLLPLITHNITEAEMLTLIMQLPSILKYDVVEIRIPYDGMYTSVNEILIPNTMDETITRLRSTIYATE